MPFVPDKPAESTGRFVPDEEPKPALTPASPRSTIPLSSDGGGAEFLSGNMWKGLANVAGMPVDFATNLANLGIAGYGAMKGGTNPPALLSNQLGGSEWLQNLGRNIPMPISKQPLISPASDPESPAGRYAASAIQMATGAGAPGAMVGRVAGRTLPNAARAGASGAASGVSSELAGDIGGEEYKPLGAMLPQAGAAMKAPGAGERATAKRKEDAYAKSSEMGIPVPPRAMKDNPVQQKLQDFANQDLKQPTGAPVTPEALQAYRNTHWKAYEAVIKDPALAAGVRPNAAFQKEIQDIGNEIMRNKTELPQTFKAMDPVLKLLGEYGHVPIPPTTKATVPPRARPIPPDVAMRAIKKLRDDANTNFNAEAPEKVELAKVQKKVANALEGLIESNLPAGSPLVQQFRDARTSIAKSHDYENALDPVTRQIDPERLSKLQTEGAPLSGRAADIAQVTGAFPEAMEGPRGGGDILTHKMSPHAALYPTNWLPHMLHRMTDPITRTRPYQAFQVDPRARMTPEQARIQALLAAAMSAQQGQIPAPPR